MDWLIRLLGIAFLESGIRGIEVVSKLTSCTSTYAVHMYYVVTLIKRSSSPKAFNKGRVRSTSSKRRDTTTVGNRACNAR
jgi:hypothetical protein